MIEPLVSASTFRLDFSRSTKARQQHPEVDRYYVVPVLLKAVAILDLIQSSPGALRVDDIQKTTGIPRSTIYRVLRTLIVRGHLQETTSGRYLISPALRGRAH